MADAPKKPMTDAERAELAQKMDDDLDRFMEGLAAKKREEGGGERKAFDFDEWCKEIEQHPAFMTDMKDAMNGEYSEEIQALQALKYSEDDEEDKQSSAEHDKKEGNKHFKLKKYRWATDCYTNGLKRMCADRKLNGILYANRSTAQKYIGNLRSAIRDAVFARKFDPMNLKAAVRGAECLLELGYAKQCLDWVESSRKLYQTALEKAKEKEQEEGEIAGQPPVGTSEVEEKQLILLDELKKKAVEVALVEERNLRKERVEERKQLATKKKLLDALAERKLNLKPKIHFDRPDLFEWSQLEVRLAQLHDHQRVDFAESGNLTWPLLVQYPEAGQTDVLTECEETVMVGVLMQNVLETPAEWDEKNEFSPENVSFFVTDEYEEHVMEVYPWTEFRQMFAYPGYQIKQGLPVLMVYTKSKVESSFKSVGENKFVVS